MSRSISRRISSDPWRRISIAANPGLDVVPLAGDLMEDLTLPGIVAGRPIVGFFPGSTLGNLEAARSTRSCCAGYAAGPVLPDSYSASDLVKDSRVLERAYDDAQGVTAAFNRNNPRRAQPGGGREPSIRTVSCMRRAGTLTSHASRCIW